MAKYHKLSDGEVQTRSRLLRELQGLPLREKVADILEQRPCYFDSLGGI